MSQAVERGMPANNNQVEHNSAADDDSLKLYAVNKWANENNVEVVFISILTITGRNLNRRENIPAFQSMFRNISCPITDPVRNWLSRSKNQLENIPPKAISRRNLQF